MGPSKRKGSVRRPVLDLNTKESSPSRLTWQTKYQQVLPCEEIQENGDASSQSNNPLSSLLGNYNSDSDSEEPVSKPSTTLDAKVEDFLKEIHSISVETKNNAQKTPTDAPKSESNQRTEEEHPSYPSSVTAWQQCYDHNSGYPYYWNTETNEVTWEMPAELKAALTSIAIKQQEQKQNQHPESQQKTGKQPQPPDEAKKKVVRYPWQTESDSEDEKIEMITSFGPQSDEESDGEIKKTKQKKSEKTKKSKTLVGPQFPSGPTGPCMDPNKIKSDSASFPSEDSEGLNEPSYETSSLLTHCVQDTGPPGDDTFLANKTSTAKKKTSTCPVKKDSSLGPASTANKLNNSLKISDNLPADNSSAEEPPKVEKIEKQSVLKPEDKTPTDVTDDIIAQIEKETPPDYQMDSKLEKTNPDSLTVNPEISLQTNSKSAGIALIANYDDDSESEENTAGDKKQHTVKEPKLAKKSLFPIEIPQEKKEEIPPIKPLFPCLDSESVKMTECPRQKETGVMDDPQGTTANIYNTDVNVSEATSHKAFKRKKRLEFATTVYGPSTSKLSEVKSSSPERSAGVSTTQYNMDPSMNEHRGFGFSSLRCEADSERKTYKNYGGIKFIKAETMNPTIAPVTESKEEAETETETASAPRTSAKEPELGEEIEDAASLLREKVTFLTGGNTHIPPIQHMAIELETLVLAWQQGALTPPYLLRWLNEKCAELIRHEKTAAPTGWTCLWDRKNKRYYYRNSATKAIQWDYPTVEEKAKGKEGDIVGGGDEMDICDTPPHMSPAESEKHPDAQSSTPPPPALSDALTNALPPSPSLQVPPHCPEIDTLVPKTTKKRKRKLESRNKEGDGDSTVSKTSVITSYDQAAEFSDIAPPLPPLPPPDESPPPLPNSPPPLPLDPDQPLPPGVDEPEYALYRRTSPKHSYKKAQNESSAYSAELMMSYGYGYSSNGQPITMQMQPLEYHTYMHETVANPYLVQSAPTSHVIQCSAKKPKVSLNSELMSFYSDLALLDATSNDNSNQDSQSASAAPVSSQERITGTTSAVTTPTPVVSVMTTSASTTITSAAATPTTTTSKVADTVTSNGLNVKKKKKVKSTTGLSLKKKGVSSLVAKWQQVQQEVRKDFSDDDDDSGAVR